jgi:SPOR domain
MWRCGNPKIAYLCLVNQNNMNTFKSLFIVSFLIASINVTYSQTTAKDSSKVQIIQDEKVKDLVNKHIDINAKAPIKGYRVKIHFGSDKAKAKEVKAQFIAKFPDVPAYEKYDQPNFNIRVGDFRTKLEAYKFLKQVQSEFPGAFLVQDEIEMPK